VRLLQEFHQYPLNHSKRQQKLHGNYIELLYFQHLLYYVYVHNVVLLSSFCHVFARVINTLRPETYPPSYLDPVTFKG
jgi:hypothetical protein